MSGKREHKRRRIQKRAFVRDFEYWLKSEPPKILFWAWLKWKKNRPVLQDYYKKKGR